MRVALLLLAFCIPLTSIAETFRIGIWNIEKLSTRAKRGFPELRGTNQHDPRTDDDLKKVAQYIRDEIAADALIVTEIDDDGEDSSDLKPRSAQLTAIVDHMGGGWKYFLGRTGGELRLGFVFNTNRIHLKKLVNLNATPFRVADEDVFDRDPFIVWLAPKRNGELLDDLLLVGVHLKSQQKFVHNHMAAMAKLMGDLRSSVVRELLRLPRTSDENDIVIVGDMNDSAHKRTRFKFMFDYLEGVGFDHLGPDDDSYPETRVNGSQIDHIFANNSAVDAGLEKGTFKVHIPAIDRDDYRATFSDHFPVTVDLVH